MISCKQNSFQCQRITANPDQSYTEGDPEEVNPHPAVTKNVNHCNNKHWFHATGWNTQYYISVFSVLVNKCGDSSSVIVNSWKWNWLRCHSIPARPRPIAGLMQTRISWTSSVCWDCRRWQSITLSWLGSAVHEYLDVQTQKAVSAYFPSKQILPFVFAEQVSCQSKNISSKTAIHLDEGERSVCVVTRNWPFYRSITFTPSRQVYLRSLSNPPPLSRRTCVCTRIYNRDQTVSSWSYIHVIGLSSFH